MEAPQNNLRIEPPCDPAASPLGVDPKERKSGPQRYTCSIIHRNKMEIVQVSSNEAMSQLLPKSDGKCDHSTSPQRVGLNDFQAMHDLRDVQNSQEAPAGCNKANGKMKTLCKFLLVAEEAWLEARIARRQERAAEG